MIITADTITLSFLVVAAVTLAVVSVLVWYVYSSKKFKQELLKMIDEKLNSYLETQQSSAEETTEAQAEQQEVANELPQSFVKKER